MVCRSAALVLALVSVLAVRVPTVLDPTPTQLIDAGLATHFYPLDDTGYSIDVPYDGRAAKTYTVPSDGIVNIEEKTVQSYTNMTLTDGQELDFRLDHEIGTSIYSRLICKAPHFPTFSTYKWMQTEIPAAAATTQDITDFNTFMDVTTGSHHYRFREMYPLLSEEDLMYSVDHRIAEFELPDGCYPLIHRGPCTHFPNTTTPCPDDCGIDTGCACELNSAYYAPWNRQQTVRYQAPIRLRTKEESGGKCLVADWHRAMQMFLLKAKAECHDATVGEVFMNRTRKRDDAGDVSDVLVYTNYEFGHPKSEGFRNRWEQQQSTARVDDLRDWALINVRDPNSTDVVRYGDMVAFRSIWHSQNDKDGDTPRIKPRQYLSFEKQDDSWDIRTTLRTSLQPSTQFVLANPAQPWQLKYPADRELREKLNFTSEMLLLNRMTNTLPSCYNTSINDGEIIAGGDGSGTRGYRPFDQISIIPGTPPPAMSYRAELIGVVPGSAEVGGNTTAEYVAHQVVFNCSWCGMQASAHVRPCKVPLQYDDSIRDYMGIYVPPP